MNEQGHELSRKKLGRTQLAEFFVNAPSCIVAMEACPGSQYWGRQFQAAGHTVRIIPAQFVKPYLKSNKNDFNDALAIAEAGSRGTMRYVPLKSEEQLELQALHRVRQRLVIERTAVVNQIRSQGIVIPVGRVPFAKLIPEILEDAENGLSCRLRQLLHRLRQRWLLLNSEVDEITREIHSIAQASVLCQRLQTVPGVGPIVATAMVAAVNQAQTFHKARDLSAWLGLVPRQYSTGGKSNLGPIGKRGNRYLRAVVIHGARALAMRIQRDQSRLGSWLKTLESRTHKNVAVVALANKIVRICWKVLTSGENYQPYPYQPA